MSDFTKYSDEPPLTNAIASLNYRYHHSYICIEGLHANFANILEKIRENTQVSKEGLALNTIQILWIVELKYLNI